MTKCGYVALLGRPNAGKSTLLNALLGAKISVVSAKPQTTRNRILGVYTNEDTQMLFLDTPGIHNATGLPQIHKAMNKAAWGVLGDANLVCYLIDIEEGFKQADSFYLKGVLEKAICPVLILLTKADKMKKDVVFIKTSEIESRIEEMLQENTEVELEKKLAPYKTRIISAKRPEDLKEIKEYMSTFIPESPWLFAADDLTDRSQQFICGEMIREQVFRQLNEELPYSCAVVVEGFSESPKIITINATIIVQKDSHKGMVIGKGAARLREIGMESRKSLEKHLNKKVFLELYVKVQENWIDDERLLSEYAALDFKN